MSTLTRRSSGNKIPDYKDYINFVSAYKNGKSEIDNQKIESAEFKCEIGEKIVTNGATCDSFSNFLAKTKNKKFESVKPPIPSRDAVDSLSTSRKTAKIKTEIYLEVNNDKFHTSETKDINKKPLIRTQSKEVGEKMKIFENKNNKGIDPDSPNKLITKTQILITNNTTPSNTQNSQIKNNDTNEKHHNYPNENGVQEEKFQSIKKLKEELYINLNGGLKKNPIQTNKPLLKEEVQKEEKITVEIETVKPLDTTVSTPVPPPPPMPNYAHETTIKITKPPQIIVEKTRKLSNTPKTNKVEIAKGQTQNHSLDRKDPLVRKLAYGAMLDMYGAYHEKANNYVATLPRNNVRKGDGLQKIIDSIAAQGGLEKLSGRSNPKTEE